MKIIIRILSVVVFSAFSMMGSSVYGMGDDWQARGTLHGFQSVQVLVAELNRDVIEMGLSEGQLKRDIELLLRKKGILLLSGLEVEKGNPILYLKIRSMQATSKGGSAFSIDLSFWQDVRLERSGEFTRAPTWSLSGIGIAHKKKFIRSSVKDFVDQFLNAWLSVNPKK